MKMLGHYHGVTDNSRALNQFHYEILGLLFKWLNRRSQRMSFDMDKFDLFLAKYPLPRPRIT